MAFKTVITILFSYGISVACFGQDSGHMAKGRVQRSAPYNTSYVDTVNCFPLQKDNIYKIYDYIIDIEDGNVIRRFKPIFDRYKFEFSGYVWEGILKSMLKDGPKEISDNVILRAEHNRLMVRIVNFNTRKTFPRYLCPIVSDIHLFEKYVRSADRTIINNY